MEVAPFGIKVSALERDGIRTTWARRVEQNAPDLHPDYEVSVGPVLKLLRASKGIRKAIRAKSRSG
jgi:hypothetical protein